ncbi:MAG: LPXTG cell wall anchor domain-containing protein, partial [Firmicutes bacterium]|nr:LPXTG cell wall anchor domain-containing protein [Bacillota bacterium]
ARAAYDGLTEEQKALVTNLDTLTAAEAALAELSPKTGDDTPLAAVTMALLVSLAGAAALVAGRKKLL